MEEEKDNKPKKKGMRLGQRKCVKCNRFFDEGEMVKLLSNTNRYICHKCVSLYGNPPNDTPNEIATASAESIKSEEIKEVEAKKSKTTYKRKEDKTPEEKQSSEDYKALYNYLRDVLCNGNSNKVGYSLLQIKRLKNSEEVNYTYSGILSTLKYIYELSDKPPVFNPDYGINSDVVRNYYKARKYYYQVWRLNQQDENKIDEILQFPETEVHINQNVVEYQRKLFEDKRKDKLYGPVIDLDDIEDEEEYNE